MADAKLQQRKKEESERLKGERSDKVYWQVVRFRKARRRQDFS